MKNSTVKIILFCHLVAPTLSYAKFQAQDHNFEAMVSSVNSKTVTVVHKGKLWEVPKKSIAQKKIKIGKTVDVIIPARNLASIKVTTPKPFKREKN